MILMPNNAQNKSSTFMAKKGDSDNSSSPYTSIWPSEFDRHTDNRDQSPVDKSVWYFVTSSMNRYIDEAAKYSHEISHLTVCLTANPKRHGFFDFGPINRYFSCLLLVLERKITFSVVSLSLSIWYDNFENDNF